MDETTKELELTENAAQEPEQTQVPRQEQKPKAANKEEKGLEAAIEQIKQQVSEDDAPAGSESLRKILGGDILSAQLVRKQIWLLLLIVLFVTISVAFRYQCQQDVIQIAQMEQKLIDIKYKALSSSSNLTERVRESHIINALRENNDSLLKVSLEPPYLIEVGEK